MRTRSSGISVAKRFYGKCGIDFLLRAACSAGVLALLSLPAAASEWKVNGGGNWTTAANWTAGVPDSPGAIADFLGTLTAANAPATVNLVDERTVGTLNIDNLNSYILASPGQLRFSNTGPGNAAANVLNGTHTISANVEVRSTTDVSINASAGLNLTAGLNILTAKSVNKIGDGLLDISGGITLNKSSFVATTGTTDADAFRSSGNKSEVAGSLVIHSGASVSIKTNGFNNGASQLSSLSIDGTTDAWTGKLDLRDNDLVVQATAATRQAVFDTITNQVEIARDTYPLSWQGNGITSSAAAAYPNGVTGLAVLLNDKGNGEVLYNKFDGIAVDKNSVLVKYTWNGDTDANGKIDADDYFRIDRGFALGLTGYNNGNFDYEGIVDAGDYFLIDNAFLLQSGVLSSESLHASAVPEPGMLGLISIAGMLLMRRIRS